MTSRRDAVGMLLGAGMISALPMEGLLAAAPGSKKVVPAKLSRPAGAKARPPFMPLGEARTLPVDYDYVEEEWFASGTDDAGQPYVTQVVVRKPRDPKRFSGTLFVEPLHAQGVASVYMYVSRYLMRSGHAWACVASQKSAMESFVKKADPQHYAPLTISSAPAKAPSSDPLQSIMRGNTASSAILAQTGAALKSPSGPLAGYGLRHILLGGHSQTGVVTTNYIREAHAVHRMANGASIYDGYFPTGAPVFQFGPREVPLIQVVSDGDIAPGRPGQPIIFGARNYRRPDSDDPKDRYRLYELAGIPHMGTRNPPNSDPVPWSGRNPGVVKPDSVMNSLPHNELFNMGLDHLVQWVAAGKVPPRAARVETGPDGSFLKDEHGNTRGGVRCVQMDVPRATSIPNPPNPDGSLVFGTFGFEVPFSKAKMKQLYGTPAAYVQRFDARLEELIRQGWMLGADGTAMRDEALAQTF